MTFWATYLSCPGCIGVHRFALSVRHHRQPDVDRRSLPGPAQPRRDVPTTKSGRRRHLRPGHGLRRDVNLLRHAQRPRLLPPVHAIRHPISEKGFIVAIITTTIPPPKTEFMR